MSILPHFYIPDEVGVEVSATTSVELVPSKVNAYVTPEEEKSYEGSTISTIKCFPVGSCTQPWHVLRQASF